MFVKMLQGRTVSTNGWNKVILEAGVRYEVSEGLAASLIRSGAAKQIQVKEVEVDVEPSKPAAKKPAEPKPDETEVVIQKAPDLETKPAVAEVQSDPIQDALDAHKVKEPEPPKKAPAKKRAPRKAKANSEKEK